MAHEIFLCTTSCTWGYGFDHSVFESSFPSFLSPYHPYLHYVLCLKTTLRPWDQMSSLTSPTWTGVWDTCQVDDLFLFYDDSLVELFLSHSVRLILSDIIVILWWICLKCIDSHIIISVEHMLDLLYIPIELFSSYQDGPSVLVAILGNIFLGYPHGKMCQLLYWGIFLFSVVEMIIFSQSYYHFLYSAKGYLFALLVTISMIYAEMSLQRSPTFRFWLSHYLWLFNRSLCWGSDNCPSGPFFLRLASGSFLWDDDKFLQQGISS